MMMVMVEVVVATAAADVAMMISSGFGIVLVFSCVQTEFSFWWYRLECHPNTNIKNILIKIGKYGASVNKLLF